MVAMDTDDWRLTHSRLEKIMKDFVRTNSTFVNNLDLSMNSHNL